MQELRIIGSHLNEIFTFWFNARYLKYILNAPWVPVHQKTTTNYQEKGNWKHYDQNLDYATLHQYKSNTIDQTTIALICQHTLISFCTSRRNPVEDISVYTATKLQKALHLSRLSIYNRHLVIISSFGRIMKPCSFGDDHTIFLHSQNWYMIQVLVLVLLTT